MIPIHKEPLSWYIDKLRRKEPFTSLLWGDGEFYVARRTRTGNVMQHGEVITREMETEMRLSLEDTSLDIYRGTDDSLLNWQNYGGRDVAQVRVISEGVECLLREFPLHAWYDGTVWEIAAMEGKLGPLLRVIEERKGVMVANPALMDCQLPTRTLSKYHFIGIPNQNAYQEINKLEDIATGALLERGDDCLCVVCAGFTTIPLAMRLRKRVPDATFLDLGSTFDIFAGIGAQRGWRGELYANPVAHQSLIAKNLEGS